MGYPTDPHAEIERVRQACYAAGISCDAVIELAKSAVDCGWVFVEAALLKEYERMKWAGAMFPQVKEEIDQSLRNMRDAIASVRFARERNMPLPTPEEIKQVMEMKHG